MPPKLRQARRRRRSVPLPEGALLEEVGWIHIGSVFQGPKSCDWIRMRVCLGLNSFPTFVEVWGCESGRQLYYESFQKSELLGCHEQPSAALHLLVPGIMPRLLVQHEGEAMVRRESDGEGPAG